MRSALHVLAPSLLLAALLTLQASAQAPSLSHSAPKLGTRLELVLEGAPPGAPVRLYASPGQAQVSTPFGTLELERTGLALLAGGAADATGRFLHGEQVPLDPALAETWRHYQALVQDPAAPAGWVLSEAAHLRLLGTRLYETCVGLERMDRVFPAELRVLSGLDLSTLGMVELADGPLLDGLPKGDREQGTPVFTDDLSLGAVVPAGDRLVVFDNFRLEPLAVVPLVSAHPALVPGLDGRSVVALETGTESLVWIDLPTATITDRLVLPHPTWPAWTSLRGGEEAWVGERTPGERRPGLRRVDLVARQALEGVLVGMSSGGILGRVSSGPGLVFAGTLFWEPFTGMGWGTLTTVDLASAPAGVHLTYVGASVPTHAVPLLEPDTLVVTRSSTFGPESDRVDVSALSPTPVFRSIEYKGTQAGELNFLAIVPDGWGFWGLDACCGWDSPAGYLMQYSLQPPQWTVQGVWYPHDPCALELVRDGLVQKVFVALDGRADLPAKILPEIHVLDLTTSTWTKVRASWGPRTLRALTVP